MQFSMALLRRLFTAIALGCFALSAAMADAPTAAPEPAAGNIRKAVEAWTGGRYQAASVNTTPIKGLYEVRIFNDLFYVDEAARYIMVEGEMIDMQSSRNITRDRLDEILAIDFSKLPLDLALKQVVGKGSRRIALFEDPNCGYCRKLRADLARLDDVTIYTFVYPILAEDSESKARKAWCAPDRLKAWTDLMMTGVVPRNDGNCETPIAQIRELGFELGITATPTLFFASGRRLQGYAPPEAFGKLLAENSSIVKR
ncbi:MAG: DsbC family protein [Pseudomonadota bacterium]|nr:DsbC family protein [Pseudomonadota bacterium]